MNKLVSLSTLPMIVLLLGCQRPADEPTAGPSEGRPAAGPPTLEELRNAAYRGFEEQEGPVTLVDGRWEGEPYEEGAVSRPVVSFVRDFHVLGDLDGDGLDEAVVLLALGSGGSGTRVHLAVVARRAGGLENVATTLLGDRVQVRRVQVEGEQLLVDVLRAGPDDAACCPGELATQGYVLERDGLAAADLETTIARLSLDAIAGTEWVLRSWAWDEAAPAEPEVTLQYVDGRFVGTSGCNRYSAPAKDDGELPGAVEVGLGIGTRMACPDPAGAVEARFLQQLEAVSRIGFMAGQLMLSWERDGAGGVMRFDGRPPEPGAGS